jgi:CTP synthase (UTP-ammonia lyase)
VNQLLKVGIIGDFSSSYPSHIATNEALTHAAGALSVALDCSWLATPRLTEPSSETALSQFDALWCAPGSPYESMAGALRAIQFARKEGRPFIGT